MLRVRKSIEIHAPVSEVFAYLNSPQNLLEIWPSMQEIRNVKEGPSGWYSFDWVYKMAGVRIEGHCDTVELEPNHLIVRKNEKGIRSTFRWTLEGRGDTTLFHSEVDYEIPGGILAKLAQPFVHALNEREAETFGANLKGRIEGGARAAQPEAQPHA